MLKLLRLHFISNTKIRKHQNIPYRHAGISSISKNILLKITIFFKYDEETLRYSKDAI